MADTEKNPAPHSSNSIDPLKSSKNPIVSLQNLLNQDYNSLSSHEIEIILAHLRSLKQQAENRSLWGKVLAGINNFVDGMFDVIAFSAVFGTIAAISGGVAVGIMLVSGPVGWAILGAIGIVAIGVGIKSAIDAVNKKSKDQEESEKKLQEAILRLDALKSYKESQEKQTAPIIDQQYIDDRYANYEKYIEELNLSAEKKRNIKEKLNQLYSSIKISLTSKSPKDILASLKIKSFTQPIEPTKEAVKKEDLLDNVIENTEAGSRHGRNAFMLGFLPTQAVFALLEVSMSILTLGITAVVFVVTAIPRFLEKIFIDTPEKAEKECVEKILLSTKTTDELEFTQNLNLNFENTVTRLTTEIILDHIEDRDMDNLMKDNDPSAGINKNVFQENLDILEKETMLRNKYGNYFAVIVGFSTGMLHPVAWVAIASIIAIALGASPLGLPILALALIGVGVVSIGIGIGYLLAKRANNKERDDNNKEKTALKNCQIAAENCQKEITILKRNTAQSSINSTPLLEEYTRYYQKIIQLNLSSQERDTKLAELDNLYRGFLSKHTLNRQQCDSNNQIFEQIFEDPEFTKIETAPTPSNALPIWQRIARDTRDFFALYEKPVSVGHALKEVAVNAFWLIATGGLALITIGCNLYKKITIDFPRERSIKTLNEQANYLTKNYTSFKSKKYKLEAERETLEGGFKQDAAALIEPSFSAMKPILTFRTIKEEESRPASPVQGSRASSPAPSYSPPPSYYQQSHSPPNENSLVNWFYRTFY